MHFIYGFGPYDEFTDNVSARIIERLSPEIRASSRVFDVVFDRALFEEALHSAKPDFILGLGQTREGEKLRIERRTLNSWAERDLSPTAIDADVADNFRELQWMLPCTEICEPSNSPGTYVCNFSMWIAENWARTHGSQFAFIHVPRFFEVDVAAEYVQSILKGGKVGEL